MSHSTAAVLVMLNNLFHDFSVALLFSCLIVLSVIGRRIRQGGGTDPIPLARSIVGVLNKVILGCWVVIILGGIVRTLAYEDFEWSEAAGRGQVTALVIKHVVLVSLVVLGTHIHLGLRRFLKELRPDAPGGVRGAD